jgi:hypothetical protein
MINPSDRPTLPADGYALLVCGTTNAINETLYDKLNFETRLSKCLLPNSAS